MWKCKKYIQNSGFEILWCKNLFEWLSVVLFMFLYQRCHLRPASIHWFTHYAQPGCRLLALQTADLPQSDWRGTRTVVVTVKTTHPLSEWYTDKAAEERALHYRSNSLKKPCCVQAGGKVCWWTLMDEYCGSIDWVLLIGILDFSSNVSPFTSLFWWFEAAVFFSFFFWIQYFSFLTKCSIVQIHSAATSKLPYFFLAQVQSKFGNIPLRFYSILTWQHYTVAAD